MTSATARTNRRISCPSETDLGGRPGDPVDLRAFNPAKTPARILGGELTRELVEHVEMGAEFLPRARRGEHKCIQCERRFVGPPALIAWLQTPGGSKRALFGVCQDCDGPDVERRLIERLGATKVALH
jgi:hypothetical protein